MLVWVAAFAALGGFLFGVDLGLIGGALLSIQEDFGVGEGVSEVIVGAAKLGAVCGTFLGGALMLYYGRRVAIAVDSAFFITGPLLMAAAQGVAALVVGRFVVGIGIGVSAVVVPAYLGEVSPAKFRGRVVELYELLLCFGMLTAALSDAAFQGVPGDWRWMVGVPAIPALLMSFALCLLPESPRWLVIHGRLDEALAVIHRIYTSKQLPLGLQNSNAEVNQELLELWSSVEKDKAAAEERRARRAAAREAAQTKVAPLAGREDGGSGGGVRFKGGWARLQEQGPDLEYADITADASSPQQHLSTSLHGALGVQPLLPGPQPRGSGREGPGSGASRHSSGSEGTAAAGGAPAIVVASQLAVHGSAGGLHARGAHPAPQGGAPLSPTDSGDATPRSPASQQPATNGSPGGAGPPPPVGVGIGMGSLSAAWSLSVEGVSPEEVLPVPRSLRRIRTKSTEFEVVQEDLKPLPEAAQQPTAAAHGLAAAAGGPSQAAGGAHPAAAATAAGAAAAATAGREVEEEDRGVGQAQRSGYSSASESEEAGCYDYGSSASHQERHGGGGSSWWPLGRRGSLRARRRSTVPWTARPAAAGGERRGFWATLGDMLLDVYIVARGPERGAFRMVLWLAFFNQAFASTAIINYAPEVLRRAGVADKAHAALFTSAVSGSKMVGVLLSFFLVDSLGRRPLLLHGSLGCAAAMALLAAADWLALVPFLVAGMCVFIFAFSVSWAGVFWVLLSEMFSMSVKSPAVSAATAMLFLTGAASDLVFLSLHSWLGPACFLVFALLALAAAAYVARVVPETKGRTLQEVQQLLGEDTAGGGGSGGSRIGELPGLLPPHHERSAPAGVELPGGRRRGWGVGWR